jgi:hypothetical protein
MVSKPVRGPRGLTFGTFGGSFFRGGQLTARLSGATSGVDMMAAGGYTSASRALMSIDLKTGQLDADVSNDRDQKTTNGTALSVDARDENSSAKPCCFRCPVRLRFSLATYVI